MMRCSLKQLCCLVAVAFLGGWAATYRQFIKGVDVAHSSAGEVIVDGHTAQTWHAPAHGHATTKLLYNAARSEDQRKSSRGTVYGLGARDTHGNMVQLSKFMGTVSIFTNVASF